MSQVRHYHHHYHFSYITSFRRHFSSILIVSIFLSFLFIIILSFIHPFSQTRFLNISWSQLFSASFATLTRLIVSYVICLIISIPLALTITSTPKIERVLLPLFDVIQSVPILAFFPLIVLVFIKLNFLEAAAVIVLVLSMLWGLTFNMVGGIKAIPEDIHNAAILFNATGFKKLFYILLPAIFPYIITGSILSMGAGWNILIVAEVLHTYIPGGNQSQDLKGLGSLLVNSTFSAQPYVFISALTMMVLLIGIINFFIWQKLLNYAQRYKFD